MGKFLSIQKSVENYRKNRFTFIFLCAKMYLVGIGFSAESGFLPSGNKAPNTPYITYFLTGIFYPGPKDKRVFQASVKETAKLRNIY